MTTRNELILFPSLKAQRTPGGALIMTQKYFEGAARFAGHWPGPVSVLVDLDDRPSDDMDRTEARPENLGFNLEICPQEPGALQARLASAAIALGFLSRRNLAIAEACNAAGVPLVCTTEYSPKTERQIGMAELSRNPLRLIRRLLWLREEERHRQNLLKRISGLQCSGTPTYELYRDQVPDALLFFDNRVLAQDVVSRDQIEQRVEGLLSGRPLHLVFGGRLIAMKGVDALPKTAAYLKKSGMPFHLTIVGSGELEESLAADIHEGGLQDCVTLHPPMDFRSGWIPFLRETADLFLCPHVQGDPSSTYPEVMSCGTPILGYGNEAFAGVLAQSDGGWSVPLRRPDKMAEMVAHLDRNREEILHKGCNAVTFAAEHAFENTFARRAAHLRDLSHLPPG